MVNWNPTIPDFGNFAFGGRNCPQIPLQPAEIHPSLPPHGDVANPFPTLSGTFAGRSGVVLGRAAE